MWCKGFLVELLIDYKCNIFTVYSIDKNHTLFKWAVGYNVITLPDMLKTYF